MISSLRKLRNAAVALTTAAVVAAPTAFAATGAGDQIKLDFADGTTAYCTLNSVANQGTALYGVTAGHCFDSGEVVQVRDGDDQVIATTQELQQLRAVHNQQPQPGSELALNDFAIFPLVPGAAAQSGTVSSVARTGLPGIDALISYITPLYAPALPLGEPVPVTQDLVGRIACKDGAITGRTCGPILAVNAQTQEIYALIPAIQGDSGSPLHVAGADGQRHIVGTLSYGSPLLFNAFDGTYEHLATS